jgi:wyosine [tRNA(Phe)-imidazoG37] synthetase (radical SAM superfamily)
MPGDGKICTFDCIYCECGFNNDFRPHLPRPSRQEVKKALQSQLAKMQSEGQLPDVLTFAGNGEPTVHPDFAGIIDDTIALRNEFCPQAKVAVLSNATRIGKKEVRDALLRVDDNILKLDTVDEEYIRLVDRPTGSYNIEEIIECLKLFEGHVMIQTMFLHGTFNDRDVSNIGPDFVNPWLEVVKSIAPEKVMIYTIDRETPHQKLTKALPEELDAIAEQIRQAGFTVSVSY